MSPGTDLAAATSRIMTAKTLAVVGLSRDETKPSSVVAKYLLAHGKEIIPVNPTADEILGLRCHSSLLAIPASLAKQIEIIDVFRKSEDIPQIAKDAIELRRRNANGKPEIFWMQLGIRNEDAARELEKSGFRVVMDRCVKIEHQKLSSQTL